METAEVVTTVVVLITTSSLTIDNPTTAAVAAAVDTICMTVVCTRAEATTTGSTKAITKDLARLEHLVVPLSPQVMVVQARRRLMTSSTIGRSINRNANFQQEEARRGRNLESKNDQKWSGLRCRD